MLSLLALLLVFSLYPLIYVMPWFGVTITVTVTVTVTAGVGVAKGLVAVCASQVGGLLNLPLPHGWRTGVQTLATCTDARLALTHSQIQREFRCWRLAQPAGAHFASGEGSGPKTQIYGLGSISGLLFRRLPTLKLLACSLSTCTQQQQGCAAGSQSSSWPCACAALVCVPRTPLTSRTQ